MTESRKGFWAIFLSASIWGLSGIYYKAFDHVPALEVIAHRTLWSAVFFGLVIIFQRRLKDVLRNFLNPRMIGILLVSAAMISVNWSGFVFAIQKGWALDASFGYYIFPLMAVVLGMVLFGEKLSKLQGIAVIMAAIAVLILGFGLGTTPWIALLLATTFSIYGLLKRRVELGPVASVFLEVLLVAPIALIYLGWVHSQSNGDFGQSLSTSLLLMGAGPMTAIPLILFSYGAQRLDFATVGLMQYANPTLQFLVAVFLFGEVFTKWHGIALPMIWAALALYSISSFRSKRTDVVDGSKQTSA